MSEREPFVPRCMRCGQAVGWTKFIRRYPAVKCDPCLTETAPVRRLP